ncbi:hypothetical protein M9M90_01160 [Phenylobacterium sp. LH3H17]|uniref:hypothetical protein n=1 Tax=Phenylobacterium sp. LH3H17 TaxID=2903901 RepID=UPI0020C9E6B1|nr:hypothetical protein [Phenylobacterium sp. LH3H17]UTP39813.1 hypothetical protein M9M90_01160 [Phenylobacterium sp. LH3H17]
MANSSPSFGSGIAAFVALAGFAFVGSKIDGLVRPEKVKAEAAAEIATRATKKAEEAQATLNDSARAKAEGLERRRKAESLATLEKARAEFLTAQTEANNHYPATDADIPEYESYWFPRERAARTRYENAYFAAHGRTAKEAEAEAIAQAAWPYTAGYEGPR